LADDRIEIEIILDDGSVVKGFARVRREAEKTAKVLRTGVDKELSARIATISKRAATLAGVLGVLSVKSFGDFEQSLIGVQKTTDISDQGLVSLKNNLRALSKEIPVGVNELASLAETAGRFGVRGVKDLTAFTETLARLSSATDLVGEEGAQSLARILGITGEATSEIGKLGL